MSIRRLVTVATVLAALAFGLPGCSGDRDALTIYSGRGRNLVGPLLETFSEETGIPIDVRYGNSADLALLIAEEGERTPADVFYSQSPGTVGFLAGRDLLVPLGDDVLGRVDDAFRSPRGLWLGVTGRQRVLVYNADTVDDAELPSSVFDLTAETYRGRVAVAPANASFQDFVTTMIEVHGEERTLEWLNGLADNDARTYANNNSIVDAVARGEIDFGLVNHYYNERFLEEDPSLPSRNHRFPDGDIGSVLLMSTVSVVSEDPRASQFVEFLLSEEAQRFFIEETFEYPLAAEDAPEGLPPLDPAQLPDIAFEELGEGLTRTIELIERSGLET